MKSLTKNIELKKKKHAINRYWRFRNKKHLNKYEAKRYKKRKHKILEYNKRNKTKSGIVIRDGYIYIAAPLHPDATKAGFILMHRLIMENQLGRRLKKEEIVHHKDNNRLNNSINNLKLLSGISAHSHIHSKIRIRENGRFMKGVVL